MNGEPDGGPPAERLREFIEQRYPQVDRSGEPTDKSETEDGEPDDPSSAGGNIRK